jgi:hypothetical protein
LRAVLMKRKIRPTERESGVSRIISCGTDAAMYSGLIDFFIVGAQKSGTTALSYYLSKHNDIEIGFNKEVHFFDNEEVDWHNPDYSLLHSAFEREDSGKIVKGEATPIYIYWPNSLERLARYNPHAKLILCLRHPAYRAYSHWRMETTRGAETLSFVEAIAATGRERVRSAIGGVHRVFSYVERGFYADQICRLQRLFAPSQVLYIRTDDLWTQTQRTIDLVQSFLGATRELLVTPAYIVPVRSSALGTLPATALRELNSLYAPNIAETASLTGLPLAEWLHPDYREPMIDGEFVR